MKEDSTILVKKTQLKILLDAQEAIICFGLDKLPNEIKQQISTDGSLSRGKTVEIASHCLIYMLQNKDKH